MAKEDVQVDWASKKIRWYVRLPRKWLQRCTPQCLCLNEKLEKTNTTKLVAVGKSKEVPWCRNYGQVQCLNKKKSSSTIET